MAAGGKGRRQRPERDKSEALCERKALLAKIQAQVIESPTDCWIYVFRVYLFVYWIREKCLIFFIIFFSFVFEKFSTGESQRGGRDRG